MITFNAIIGNPPYQISDGGGGADDAAGPVYHEFVRLGRALMPTDAELRAEQRSIKPGPPPAHLVSLIMPAKWMVGGRAVLRPFLREMDEDRHLVRLFDYEDDHLFFPSANNDGGICYFLHDRWANNHGLVDFSHRSAAGVVSRSKRRLGLRVNGRVAMVVRQAERLPVVEKVMDGMEHCFSEIVSARRPFGITHGLFNNPEKYPLSNLSDRPFPGSQKIYGVKGLKGGAKRCEGYISPAIITKNREWADRHKLLFTTSYTANAPLAPEDILSRPGTLATETFLVVGPFDTEEEMQRCHRYLHTDFARALLCFGHGTARVTSDVFLFVPLPDFSDRSAVPWGASDEELDRWFYNQFGLTRAEQAVIRRTVHPALRAGNQA